MIPENTSPADKEHEQTQAQLDEAAITVIAAWRNGHGLHTNALGVRIPAKELQALFAAHIRNYFAHALWTAILHYENYPQERSYENIVRLAKAGTPKSAEEWEAFWQRVEAARPHADEAAMCASAQVLTEHFLAVQKWLGDELQERAERNSAETYRAQQARAMQKPAFTLDDMRAMRRRSESRFDDDGDDDDEDEPLGPIQLFGHHAADWGGEQEKPLAVSSRLLARSQQLTAKSSGSGERFKDYSAADALEPLLPIESLVDQLMQPASVSIMFGKPGTKKTYAMLWLAVCVALGKDWLGFKTRQSPVLFVDEESGHDRLHRRLHEVLLGAGGNAQTPIRWIPPSKFRFNEQEDLDALCSKILAREAKLIIIDSLAASSSGDENSKKDMQPVMSGARYIAERTGAHVAIIHHSPKSDNNNNGTPRGSSVFEAEPDLVLEMKSPQGSPFVTYATVKNRDGEAKKWAAQCHWNTNADPNLSTFSMEWAAKVESGERELSPLRQWILDYLEEKGESKMQAILDAGEQDGMGARLSIRDAIRILARDKLIYRTNPDEKGYGATAKYALTEPEGED